MSNKTSFGFKQIEEDEKQPLVKGVFESVASRYDVMNDVMSLGIHRLWKQHFIKKLAPRANTHLLDVAGGTGDIAFRFLDNTKNAQVTLCDINHTMLENGYRRAIDENRLEGIEWVCGNAESLPFPNNHFDYYTIAFGIRNVTHIDHALKEAWRVLKPGGRFLCLEFSHVTNPILKKIYNSYSFHLIPAFGKIVTQDRASYQYLVESIQMFPKQEEFLDMIKTAGFLQTSYENLTHGIVAIHSGWKV